MGTLLPLPLGTDVLCLQGSILFLVTTILIQWTASTIHAWQSPLFSPNCHVSDVIVTV